MNRQLLKLLRLIRRQSRFKDTEMSADLGDRLLVIESVAEVALKLLGQSNRKPKL